MDDSHEIEFNPKSRSSIGENETLNRNSSEMISISRQQSIESLNTVDEYQNKNSRNETNEIIHVVTMLRDEIKQNISENTRNMNSCEIKIDEIQQTMSNISSENIRNTNSIDMKIQDLKGYLDRQMSNVKERVSHLTEGQAFPEIRQNIVNNNSQHPTGCGDNQKHHQSDKVQINGDSENMSRQNQQTYSYEQSTSHSHNSVNNSHFDPQIQYRNRQLHPSHSGNYNNRQGNYNNRQDNFQNNRSTVNDNRGNNFSSENQRIENNQETPVCRAHGPEIDNNRWVQSNYNSTSRVLDEGLFVLAGIYDKTINMMLDTGASVTILSKKSSLRL
ncbi:unnamed protein product [Mytilus edulis]|uniref:Peptidase A2 domain-containing protein n=1 Tax=Mytilus edulis TaxID=6550 RepID=A0A8S3R3F1_MYTED|nr:unnamed protein product [Mytilus edulis]